jgi:hypothetical protein
MTINRLTALTVEYLEKECKLDRDWHCWKYRHFETFELYGRDIYHLWLMIRLGACFKTWHLPYDWLEVRDVPSCPALSRYMLQRCCHVSSYGSFARRFGFTINVWSRGKFMNCKKDSEESGQLLMCVLGGNRLWRVEVKWQIDQRIRNNRQIRIYGTVSEMSTRHGKQWYRNNLKPNRKVILFL